MSPDSVMARSSTSLRWLSMAMPAALTEGGGGEGEGMRRGGFWLATHHNKLTCLYWPALKQRSNMRLTMVSRRSSMGGAMVTSDAESDADHCCTRIFVYVSMHSAERQGEDKGNRVRLSGQTSDFGKGEPTYR